MPTGSPPGATGARWPAASCATIDQIMRLGYFHADPHPGNVFVLADGSLGLIDFGAVGRLGPIEQRAIVDMFFAISRRDVGLLREGVVRSPTGTEMASDDELERALGRLMAEHVRPGGGTIDPAVMQELVATLSRPRVAPPDRRRTAVPGARHRRRHDARALPDDDARCRRWSS